MANTFVIEAEPREVVGKQVKQLRRQGLTPAVIYGQNEPISIQVDTLKTHLTLRDAANNDILEIKIGDDTRRVLARDVQRHVTRGDLIHVDFLEVNEEMPIRVEAKVVARGRSVPEAGGLGRTNLILQRITIEAKPADLVSVVEADLSIIDTPARILRVADLTPPENVTFVTPPQVTVAKFVAKRGQAAGAAPAE